MFSSGLLMDTDSYKTSHFLQYPPNTTKMFSYLEAREGSEYSHTVFFGLQNILRQLSGHCFDDFMINEAEDFYRLHGVPFNRDGWNNLYNIHKGKLPIRIKAVKEGSILPISNALVTVESTDPEFYWLVGHLETMIMRLWYPITVATRSRYCKELIYKYLQKTSDNPDEEINFKLHDFGSRGSTSEESAAIGGAAHLVNFMGSDTVTGIYFANTVYGHDMAGFSIPAAEHSTITSWGEEYEVDAYRNMLQQFAKPGSLVAVVSDSYDLYNAVEHIWGGKLRQEVIDSGATVIIRPDSGIPVDVVSNTLSLLDERFGHTVNSKGYKVLNHVRVIQGDGITEDSMEDIMIRVASMGYSLTNVAFGMGGGLLQKLDRDTMRFAFKCSYIEVDGVGRDVFKNPKTDSSKSSKRGYLDLVYDAKTNSRKTIKVDPNSIGQDYLSVLNTVFENGELLDLQSFNDVRNLVNKFDLNLIKRK